MTPVIPSPTSSISFIPGCAFDTRKTNSSIRCCNIRKSSKRTLYAQDCVLPLSTSLRLFAHFRTCGAHCKPRFGIASSTGVDVAVEQADQADSPVSGQDSGQSSETAEESSAKSKQRSRPVRKSEMPPVKDEELVPGATFTGKVRSIQPFGAFVDFGAFTDGLVHVSRLSDSFVKDVASVVSIGQEVKVKLVEANIENGRIALTMRESEPAGGGEKSRTPKRTAQKSNQRRDEGRKTTKFEKGQDLEGTVKNLTRSGAFISLPEGEEGFLPASEEADEGFGNIMGGSSLEIGQQVKVRVLRIARGQVTLTMKKEEDAKALDSKLEGTVFTATNPFLVAFRKNKDIASFLDEREKAEDTTEIHDDSSSVASVVEDKVDQESQETVEGIASFSDTDEIRDDSSSVASVVEDKVDQESQETVEGIASFSDESEKTEDTTAIHDDSSSAASVIEDKVDQESQKTVEGVVSFSDESKKTEDITAIHDDSSSAASLIEDKVDQESQETVEGVASFSDESEKTEDTTEIHDDSSSAAPVIKDKVDQESQETMVVEVKSDGDSDETEPSSSLAVEDEITAPESDEDEKIEPVADENSSIASEEQVIQEDITEETQVGEVVENHVEETAPKVEVDAEIPAATPVEATIDGAAAKKNGGGGAATISPSLVKQLREETGVGMMDCKKALSETEGDLVKAQEYLRKKGLASADKKASRATAEGRIGSYVHDSRIGVLVEVNCETDFVSRGDIFKELVNDLAMQVAACPQVQYLATEDVPEGIVEKEKEIEMQKEDLLSKPEQFRAKIVEGRIKKRLEELALLEQAYIKNDKVVVKDFIKSTIATIGENIKLKRFVRFNLGEGLEKRTQDFAAEVAAQASATKVAAPAKEPQPAPTQAIDAADEAPKVAISAALVKQLREESGAGMMDCKKALSETGGDLEKAQEYLRKKGLSTADKKSSRLAAEGRIGSYIHDSRIGVLIEVNCETDFVGRSEKFKELVEDLAMQVVACPRVEYVSIEDIPESVVSKEKELEMQREDILSRPENIRERIVEGRVAKRLGELALLEQPYLKDDSIVVKDLVKQTVAAIGENIKVRRFVRFTLGESGESN